MNAVVTPESPSTNDRILVFIPGYNCAKQIGRVIAQLASPAAPPTSEVLVVDNRSTDGTADVAAAALQKASPSKWKVVRNQSNYNLGGSHKVAFNYALEHGFTHVIVLHGDDQASIQDFTAPIAAGLHRKHDSLLGARFMKGSQLQGYSLYKTIGNYGLNVICGLLLFRWIADQGSGLNLYSTKYLSSRFYSNFDDTLVFPNMMFLYGVMAKSDYKFVPITWREEDQSSNARAVRQAIRVIRLTAARKQVAQAAASGSAAPARDYPFDVVASGG